MAQKDKQKQQQSSPLDEPPTASSSSSSSSSSSEEEEEEVSSEPSLTPAEVKPQPLFLKSASKRPAENAAAVADDPKRAKKKSSSNPYSPTANKSRNKVWSEQDEVALLKGAFDFILKTGQDPVKRMYANAFLDFIKKSLHVEVSPSQLTDKLKKLKIKFRSNSPRGENCEDPTFLKPHHLKLFQLSKKVWGSEIGASAAQNIKKKETRAQVQAQAQAQAQAQTEAQPQTEAPSCSVASEKMQIVRGGESLLLSICKTVVMMDENDLKRAVELIDESKRAELEERWKKLQLAEMELVANRSKLIADQIRLIHEVLKDQ